ncbi:excalibur calcium-binding domain-containing protein [Mycobacterium hackensackense]|nr:excalibur calcium-binding domain-containing protein [Mycobacterium hackensackense]
MFSIATITLSIPALTVVLSPTAHAYSNCAEARAAGAAPLYAGQPGYSRKLDRDGDGVACETGGSGSSGGLPPQVYPTYPPIYATPAQTPAPVATAGSGITTVVNWTGAECIDITAPNQDDAGVLHTGSFCGGSAQFHITPTSGAQMVGADPSIGSADWASCEILPGRLVDSGTAGDGQDINCLTRFDALP